MAAKKKVRRSLCQTQINLLRKIHYSLDLEEKINGIQLILSEKNKKSAEKANQLVHETMEILQTIV